MYPAIGSIFELPDAMSADAFFGWVGAEEHERLDFKRRFQRDDQRHIVAMAMTAGGILVVGVDDDGTIAGASLDQPARDRITGAGQDVHVAVTVREVAVDGTPITLVGVPEVRGRVVTTTDGRVLRRVGSSSRPLTGDQLARFVRERVAQPAEEDVVAVPDEAGFDREAIGAALDAAGRPTDVDPSQAIVDFGLAERQPDDPRGITYRRASVIAFSSTPSTLIPGARVQFIRRRGSDAVDAPVTRREEFDGPLVDVIDHVLGAILEEVPRYESITGSRRSSTPLLPETALREVVVNALAHRDYGLENATTDILVTDDLVRVQSPGSLPGHVTVDNIRAEHYSRNPRLMRFLRAVGLVEGFGDGVDRVFEDMAERLLPEPLYTATDSSVTVTLRFTSSLSLDDQVWLGTLRDIPMTRDQRRVLVTVRDEGRVTRRRTRELALDGDPDDVVTSMLRQRLLEARGRRGGSFYVLSDELRARSGDSSILAEHARRQAVLDELQRRADDGLSTREASRIIDEAELRPAREILNGLVAEGLARAEGRTAARRYFAR